MHGDALREMMYEMNGPRVYWGRGLEIALKLFITFNRGEIFTGTGPSSCLSFDMFALDCTSVRQFFLAYKLVVTSWMAAEQVVYKRQKRANEMNKSGLKYIHCY